MSDALGSDVSDSPSVDRAGRFSRLDEPLLTPREAACLLAVPVSWIYAAARERRVPCVRLGRHVRFVRTQLEQFVLEQGGTR